jgi:hypothetical protein
MANGIQRRIAKKPMNCATVTEGLSGQGSAWKLRLVVTRLFAEACANTPHPELKT